MRSVQPLLLVVAAVSGWVHRQQADTIAYLVEENRVTRVRRVH
jgi:hypothetical protein